MKWFKHESDASTNAKLQVVIDKFGLKGYGYYWACIELVAKEGENYRIFAKKGWKMLFKKFLNIEIGEQDAILECFAEVNLIDKKALNKGDLYAPKLAERCDEYTDKKRRISRQGRDNVGLEEIRTDKKRREEIMYTPEFENFWKLYPKKVGKSNAFKEWEKLSTADREKIMEDIPKRGADEKWAGNRDGVKFIKDPERYIKNRQWEDDIIRPKGQKQAVQERVPKASDRRIEDLEDKRSPEEKEKVRKMFEATNKLTESKRIN